ncbi:lecithin retinol acyltransferase family protein [uncultured Phascolarctobacterium sp.]|uniref:lecithin retinol acyltransferase family protein n=1 Tax=uncultured Phascolarctobacterium sp. TaxID=512296 RepID=UPI0025F73EF3|nr:lecithin retinol acyltransferase family protein [uncultured Phascolarctobacterium sp.]
MESVVPQLPITDAVFTEEIWVQKNPVMGDHIRVKRMHGIYTHHGIYVSDNEVIHFTGTDDDSIMDSSKNRVISSDLNFFLKGGELEVKEYTDEEFQDLYAPDQIVAYARSCIGDGDYNVIFNNCEHFANVCTLGRFRSHQVERLLQNKGVDDMSIFGKIGGWFKGLFGGSSSGGSRSTSSTVYEPDKVRIAEIEQNTKIRLATMERERQELMHKAQLEFLQAHYDCEEALVQAKVRGFAATAEMIVRMQSKLTEIAETRMEIIEKGSLPIVKDIEKFYDELGDKVKADKDKYNLEQLPKLLALLGEYKVDSTEHKLYEKLIEEDMRLQSEYYMKQLDNIAIRQQQVIDGFIKSKNSIIEQTGLLTKELLASVQKQTLELSQGGETSLKEIQQKQQALLSGQKPLALSEGKQDEVKNK